ncbi:MAG: hypothetical protein RLZZ406_1235 [Pseudomonadota bacterium]
MKDVMKARDTKPWITRNIALVAHDNQKDELLDWREMHEFYQGAQQLILEGSDHGIADYADHLPRVLEFISPEMID